MHCCTPQAGDPGDDPETGSRPADTSRRIRRSRRPPLFALAPGGVFPATAVTSSAVRSYRTISPLPFTLRQMAVSFLWHFPSPCGVRPLTGAVFPWSPDFPREGMRLHAVIQPTGARTLGRLPCQRQFFSRACGHAIRPPQISAPAATTRAACFPDPQAAPAGRDKNGGGRRLRQRLHHVHHSRKR